MTQAAAEPQSHRPPYKIIVDRRPHDWPEPFITGTQIKQIAGVDLATYDAWQDVSGPEDKLIADAEQVDLTAPPVERFFTGKKTTTEG